MTKHPRCEEEGCQVKAAKGYRDCAQGSGACDLVSRGGDTPSRGLLLARLLDMARFAEANGLGPYSAKDVREIYDAFPDDSGIQQSAATIHSITGECPTCGSSVYDTPPSETGAATPQQPPKPLHLPMNRDAAHAIEQAIVVLNEIVRKHPEVRQDFDCEAFIHHELAPALEATLLSESKEMSELEAMAAQLEMAYGDFPKDRPPGPPTSIIKRLRELASVSSAALPSDGPGLLATKQDMERQFDKGDRMFDIPQEIIEAEQKVSIWMAEQNVTRWKLGGSQQRGESAPSATLEWQAWDESEGHDHGLVWWTDGESVSIGSLSAHGAVWHILGVHGPKCSDMKPTHYLPLNPPRYVSNESK